MGKDIQVIGNFTSYRKLEDLYYKTVTWLEESLSLTELGWKKKITYKVESKTPHRLIEFKIKNNTAPRLSHSLRNARIEFTDRVTYVEIWIEIPIPHSGDPPTSYPIYLHDYMYQICEGILDELSPRDLAEIYPEIVLKQVINKRHQGYIFFTILCLLLFLASIWSFRSGYNWTGFFLLLFSGACLMFFYKILHNQIKKYRTILQTQRESKPSTQVE